MEHAERINIPVAIQKVGSVERITVDLAVNNSLKYIIHGTSNNALSNK